MKEHEELSKDPLLQALDRVLEQAKSSKRELVFTDDSEREKNSELAKRFADVQIRNEETHGEGLVQYYKLREKWSKDLSYLIAGMVIFQMILSILIGIGWLSFTSDMVAFPYLIAGENFGQIVAMGYIVVKFLFPKVPKEDPKKGESQSSTHK